LTNQIPLTIVLIVRAKQPNKPQKMNVENPAVEAIYESPYSQTELSEEFGVGVWHFNRVVNRRSKSKPLEKRIAKKLGVEIAAIFPDREEKKRGSRTSASTEGRSVNLGRRSARSSISKL
jgi:hypothetical protein